MVNDTNPFVIPSGLKESKKGKLNRVGSVEISDSFLAGGSPSLWLGGIISGAKSSFFFLAVILLFLLLGSRLFYLQIIKGDYYRQLAEGNRTRLEYLPAARGIIFDQFGKPLVANQPTFSLIAYPQELKKEQYRSVAGSLNELDSEQLLTLAQAYSQESYFPVVLGEDLDYEQAIALMVKLNDFSGFKIEVDAKRRYLFDNALAHILGYTSRITQGEKDKYLQQGYLLTERVGRSGLEESYQSVLRGALGRKRIEVDSLGREQKVIAQEDPLAGHNIILNIDSGLQERIVEVLNSRIKGQAGAVVALDPRSGKVRALVSWPLFDHNAFSQGLSSAAYQSIVADPLNPLFNRAISGEYPPGSTIKLVLGAAALEEGLITKYSQILSLGGIWYDKWFFPDWKAGGHGYANIIKALAESVNTYFYYLALEEFDGHYGLGLDKMLSYFRAFGLAESAGINLSNESGGFLPSREWKQEAKGEVWYPGDTLHLAIGQGDILVTPLQIANFTAAVANGGVLYKPELVGEIIDPATDKVQKVESEILNKDMVKPEYLEIIKEGMRAAVTSGSARGVYYLSIPLAGKTGTAQAGGDKNSHAWFTSFGPYSDPQLVLTVLVEYGGEGSEAAAPIARDIWQWYAENRM
ncbi:penicillin-binding protein 2 [Patescibacteria group bacterium]|nr:penicillin-binding protein 2 [Patescibacteria group bacterium]